MKRTGILLNDDNDSGEVLDLKVVTVRDAGGLIVSGLTVGDTLEQNKALIVIAHQGDFKFNPDLGVGIEDILLDSDFLAFRHRIREHLGKDGLRVDNLDFSQGKPLKIDASYE